MTIPEGGRSCYWCGEWIPYTINPIFWWCFECHRYTGDSQPEEDRYIGHICKWKIIPGPKLVMYACTNPNCNKTFMSTPTEYQRDLKKEELAQHVHSREFQIEVQAIMSKAQEVKAERRAILYAKFEKEMGG